jgi:NADPH-dependent ferric siderophore reductase
MVVPDIFDSYLLIGDETALPAIARRLEGLAPTGVRWWWWKWKMVPNSKCSTARRRCM